MPASPTIRLVIFDLGGVIVRVNSWEEAHAAAGLDPSRFPGDQFTQDVRAIVRELDGGIIDGMQFEERAVAVSRGVYTYEEVRRMHDCIVVGEYEGIGAVFDALEAAGVATGILSNTNHVHWQTLAALDGLPPRFPTILRAKHIYASHLLQLMKPDRAIFDHVCAETGHDPADIVFFDDLEANVMGARAAGWRAQRIDPDARPANQIMAALRTYGVVPAGVRIEGFSA